MHTCQQQVLFVIMNVIIQMTRLKFSYYKYFAMWTITLLLYFTIILSYGFIRLCGGGIEDMKCHGNNTCQGEKDKYNSLILYILVVIFFKLVYILSTTLMSLVLLFGRTDDCPDNMTFVNICMLILSIATWINILIIYLVIYIWDEPKYIDDVIIHAIYYILYYCFMMIGCITIPYNALVYLQCYCGF